MSGVSKRKCIAAGRDVQLPWGAINREDRTRRLIHGLVKQTQFCVSFFRSMVTKKELSNSSKLSIFESVFVPIPPYRWPRILGND